MSLDPGHCKSCGKPVLWGSTVNDKPMPLDPTPLLDGNMCVHADGRVGGTKGQPPGPRYVSHFATCPHAAQHRK